MLFGLKRIVLIFIFVVFIVISVIIYGQVFSYDTEIAHPFLTEKAVELFNQSSEIQISQQQLEWLKQGVIEEDTPIRWMNHFYNPITGRGLWGFLSAKDWSLSEWQMIYPKGNQTWQKAIEFYTKGDKKQAFIALGHTLHLIEDMSVSAHTRDDAHPEGDPYESWVKNNAKKNFDGISAVNFDNLNKFFDLLSGYSNKYFLSKDTIDENLVKNLETKTVILDDKVIDCFLYYDNENKKFCIISGDKNFINPQKRIYYLTSINHSDYYSLLAPKAISYGAGVIELFFQEIEKEEQKQLEKSWPDKLKEKIGITQPASPIVAIMPVQEPEPQQENQDVRHSVANNLETIASVGLPMSNTATTQNKSLSSIQSQTIQNTSPQPTTVASPSVSEPFFSVASPGFGGGGAPPPAAPPAPTELTPGRQ